MATNKNEKIFHPLQAFLMVLMVNGRFRGAGGSRSLHHSPPRMEKEYDVVNSSRHHLLYAPHQNLIIHISPSTQR